MPNKYVSQYNVVLIYLMALICYWTYYKLCTVSPGIITTNNSAEYI